MKRIAIYGGSFDPVHRGHLKIAEKLTALFELDEFVFVPAFHAPHKLRSKPTSAYHRYAMLALATRNQPKIKVSKMELEAPEKPYTIETLTKIIEENSGDEIYFVMGADSWSEITTWKEWEKVLTIVNTIVVTRPEYEIGVSHVTDGIRQSVVDLRKNNEAARYPNPTIFFSDPVRDKVSSTEIRRCVFENLNGWEKNVSREVAKYIRKYRLYN